MRTRAAALLLVMAMIATVALRSTPPQWPRAAPTETCRQAQSEGDTPYTAPQHEGQALQDLVNRANAWPLAAMLPANGTSAAYGGVVETPQLRPRRSPWTPRQHIASKRYRIQPDANDPA